MSQDTHNVYTQSESCRPTGNITGIPTFKELVWFVYKVSGVMCSVSTCEHYWSIETDCSSFPNGGCIFLENVKLCGKGVLKAEIRPWFWFDGSGICHSEKMKKWAQFICPYL